MEDEGVDGDEGEEAGEDESGAEERLAGHLRGGVFTGVRRRGGGMRRRSEFGPDIHLRRRAVPSLLRRDRESDGGGIVDLEKRIPVPFQNCVPQ